MFLRDLRLLLGAEKSLSLGVKACGVRRSQLTLIIIVGNTPGCQICHIARLLEVKHQTASIRIGILTARGYVYRNGRKFYLTGPGRSIFDAVYQSTRIVVDTYKQEICRALGRPTTSKTVISPSR